MAFTPKYAVIPVSAVADTPEAILAAVNINRAPNPDGSQDDHSSAFALLKQVLLSQLNFCNDNENIRITPVFRSLLNMAIRECDIYLQFMHSQKYGKS